MTQTPLNSNNQDSIVDIAIVGGGLAGFSLAAALLKSELSITLINAQPQVSLDSQQAATEQFDDRALALSHTSINYLSAIDVLDAEQINDLTEIHDIHVSDRGHIGMTRLSSQAVNKPYLGKVMLAKHLGHSLLKAVQSRPEDSKFKQFFQTTVDRIEQQTNYANLHLSSGEQLSAKLVVLAEGGQSGLSEQLGIQGQRSEYGQVGILANVSTSTEHNNIAYERFTANGPIALLPLREKDYKLVWTVELTKADEVMAYDDQQFLSELQKEFGDRAGLFELAGKRVAYPMFEVQRNAMHSGRVVLIGNSAHTLHPIAGQGFNLGLRDVACLVSLLEKQTNSELGLQALNAQQLAYEYAEQRASDVKRTSMFTDGLVRAFSSNALPKAILRNIGLLALQNAPSIKNRFVRLLSGKSNSPSVFK